MDHLNELRSVYYQSHNFMAIYIANVGPNSKLRLLNAYRVRFTVEYTRNPSCRPVIYGSFFFGFFLQQDPGFLTLLAFDLLKLVFIIFWKSFYNLMSLGHTSM